MFDTQDFIQLTCPRLISLRNISSIFNIDTYRTEIALKKLLKLYLFKFQYSSKPELIKQKSSNSDITALIVEQIFYRLLKLILLTILIIVYKCFKLLFKGLYNKNKSVNVNLIENEYQNRQAYKQTQYLYS